MMTSLVCAYGLDIAKLWMEHFLEYKVYETFVDMYQLAEINVARMIGVNIDDPIMQEFVDNLDSVNLLAESSEG